MMKDEKLICFILKGSCYANFPGPLGCIHFTHEHVMLTWYSHTQDIVKITILECIMCQLVGASSILILLLSGDLKCCC